jgi:hypothetical protein
VVDIAVLERNPFARSHAGGGGEEHHRPEPRPKPIRERLELLPRLERALLGAPSLRVLDPLLGGVDVEPAPEDCPGEHLAKRLGRLEAVAGRDGRPPGRDLGRVELVEGSSRRRPAPRG